MPINYQMTWDPALNEDEQDSMLLSVSADNPRYFADQAGEIVFITGSHTWANFHSRGADDPPPTFDWTQYLDYLETWGHNCVRLWCEWETPDYPPGPNHDLTFHHAGPWPWPRSGPGNANDGRPKFDVSQFDSNYFDRLRSRCIDARTRGIYVCVNIFNLYTLANYYGSTAGWPFASGNNINSVAASPSDWWTEGSALTAYQDLLIEQYIDAVGDLSNVLWQTHNEKGLDSTFLTWCEARFAKIRAYETATGNPHHLIGMGSGNVGGFDDSSTLLATGADFVCPALQVTSAGIKPIIHDSDHCLSYDDAKLPIWPFRALCRGAYAWLMDGWYEVREGQYTPTGTISGRVGTGLDPSFTIARYALGDARGYAERLNLKLCVPHGELSSTGLCIANPGAQYLAAQPGSGAFSLTTIAGTYDYEWWDPVNRTVNGSGSTTVSSGSNTFTPPFSGPAVLLLEVP